MKKIILVVFLFSQFVFSQTTAKDKFFADYEAILDEVRQNNGSVLSPNFYEEAVKYFEEADQAYEEKESQKVIREKLDQSALYARRAMEVIKLANLTLEQVIETRNAALGAEAPLYAEKLWEDAEEYFRDAVSNLEDDDVEDAKEDGFRAQQLYNQAELLAIKNGILNDAREAISAAREMDAEDYAFSTLIDAQNQLTEAERLLESDRYARDEAIKKANRAAYQGRHAQYLTRTIKELSQKDENWEKLILKFEDIISQFAEPFNFKPEFDQGFDASVKTIAAYIKNLKDEKKQLVNENNDIKAELLTLKEQVENTSAELERKKDLERKVEKIKSIFLPSEGKVIYEGDNLIISLYGLTFPSGQSIIQPEYFSLLTKVQQSLREFPDSHYLIEGHTDALGNATTNKILSEKRAKSVQEYLIANMDLETSQISAIGYGEDKPVASNETAQGRALNRRIDVVININK